ncbi:hypothetical protein PIB30_092563 [Stylosanthes scabra]|uniref:Uncharacterized protein n=1 Tax=Stylosanthes scabra TaxID=79078 RepID=A0ABU6ZTH5_9FABA|nr:hypothetical protein [Stylosanthes scabra]
MQRKKERKEEGAEPIEEGKCKLGESKNAAAASPMESEIAKLETVTKLETNEKSSKSESEIESEQTFVEYETKTRQSLKIENKPKDHGRLRRGLEDEDGKRTRRLEDFFELEDGDRGLGYDGAAEASEATTLHQGRRRQDEMWSGWVAALRRQQLRLLLPSRRRPRTG